MGKKIYVVEDDAVAAKLFQQYIEKMGYQFAGCADNAETALHQIRQLQPDLVLMDISLKGVIDGIEAAERLHADGKVAVIFLTASADDETLTRAKVTEPFGYLVKSFGMPELKANIEMALYKKEMENKLAGQVDEMRRMNAVLMEREMRFLELKREVNEVLRQHGQPVRYHSVE